MRCLWLTLVDPEPRHNGQLLYSGGLIEGAAAAGIEIHVLGLAREGQDRPFGARQGNVTWWLAPGGFRPRWRSLLSPLPHMASRVHNHRLREILLERLDEEWGAIVFDGISAGWALDLVQRRLGGGRRRRPRLIYVSHNHEVSLRDEVARSHPLAPMRLVLRSDTWKVARLERRMIGAMDAMTAITEEDRALYAREWPGMPIEIVPPGYDGPALEERTIENDLPRRAVVVGSFDWIAKQLNLEEFVAIADPLFAAAGAELQVVGNGDRRFLDRLRATSLATEFTGRVEDVTPYMRQARIAIVPERHGGGFKLKVLDYVFGRMPILALDGSVAGTPLQAGQGILYFRDHLALARGALRIIDDCDRLNALQRQAYEQCRENFRWADRGRRLHDMLAAA